MRTCPAGHETESGDYCDMCGLAVSPGPASAPSVAPCRPAHCAPRSADFASGPPDFGAQVTGGVIESADAALQRSAEPAIFDQLIAGGAMAASVSAAASVAKSRFEATTQRRKNELDAEVHREEIASQERQAALHEREETKRARQGGHGRAPQETAES